MTPYRKASIIAAANLLSTVAQGGAEKWWHDPETGEPLKRNFGEMVALAHSELSEALEAHRKQKQDDHLPHLTGIEVELADAVLRIFDMARHYDLPRAIAEKLAYNETRADHSEAARTSRGGKAY